VTKPAVRSKVPVQPPLTEEEMDQIISSASADDVVEAMALYPDVENQSMQLSREIFNRSAERLGFSNGVTASQRIPAREYRTWTQKLGTLLSGDSPKAGDSAR